MHIRSVLILTVFLLLLSASCRKGRNDGADPIPPDTCSRKKLTGVDAGKQGKSVVLYNSDGTLDMGDHVRYFNNGALIEGVGRADVVVYDSIGRVKSMNLPFDFEGKRQMRYYFYDSLGRVSRTLTHTGNGIDYWAGLLYDSDGDVVEMYYGLHEPPHTSISRFTFSYYDTAAVDQYLAQQSYGQIGIIPGKHLLKSASYSDNKYSYVLDSNMRVLVSYNNYDNTGWYYSRATDTTRYTYSCK